jgi:hypothetical protein
VVGGVGLQARANRNLLYLRRKLLFESGIPGGSTTGTMSQSSLLSWASLTEFEGSWTDEPTASEMHEVLALVDKVNNLRGLRLTGVSVVTNWLARRVIP